MEGSSVNSSPPTIVKEPKNRRVLEGKRARFAVTATGDIPLAYQWSKNGEEISGATNSVYATPPVTLGDNGAAYSVVVSNPGGSTTSRQAILAVTPK